MNATEIIRASLKRELSANPSLSVNAWALQSGVSEGGLRDFLKGRAKSITITQLEKLAISVGKKITDFLPGGIPLVGKVGAGSEVFPFDDAPYDEVDMPTAGCPTDAVAVEVEGDSMFPDYWPGDILIYRRDMPFDRNACLYQDCIVRVHGGPTLIKRVKPGSRPDVLTLESINAPPRIDQRIEWAAPVMFHDKSRRKPAS
ncbi:S24 family peptidase [Niveispirillum sp.]|uniref:S24 family peptidase n=1 Tax=Niveispirillum sp. TaxID=1917217 RepID=UPI001B6F7F29|nr:S24 family peptidase [Niveispirillum sp.]MBP7337690.1 helix-turn-helix transcriptional regulator [Niveispirillum sp.]